jgi:chromate transporter
MARALEVFVVFTRLGLTSFGGPVAHLGYFRDELVARRRWLDDARYADLVALCQFLPGPASSQVGMGLGLIRAGVPGALAAFLGFTWPSALLLVLFAQGVAAWGDLGASDLARGLKVAAVAVVAHAVWGMATQLTPDRPRATLALLAAALALVWPSTPTQLVAIALGALVGWRWLAVGAAAAPAPAPADAAVRRPVAVALLAAFALLLAGLPLLRAGTDALGVAVVDAFYRAGALVFGGGHVVLPLLQAEVVPVGWVDGATFTLGYGAAQAVPGPLFTFAGFLGAAMAPGAAGVGLGLLALGAVFLPSFLLLLGIWPFWDRLRAQAAVRAALRGVNAVVVGLLLAALYHPVWTSAIVDGVDVALALVAFLALALWRWPAWLVVLGAGVLALLGGLLPLVGRSPL